MIDAISHGKAIYCILAEGTGIDPVAALISLPSRLKAKWRDPARFLGELGNDNALAIIEARSHFSLPPLEDAVIDMDELKKFRDNHLGSISRGENTYIALAEQAGVDPVESLQSLPSIVSSQWHDPEHFLAYLGNDDTEAILEARGHFGLPPLE